MASAPSPESTPPSSAPLVLPRGLIFLSTGWLAMSWLLAIGFRPPITPSTAVYTPAAQILICSIVIGGLVAWPLGRLTAETRTKPVTATLLDLISLCVLIQVVIWPMRLVTNWTIPRLLLIDASICAWLTIVSAILCLATLHRGLIRSMAMLVILVWLIGPLLMVALDINSELFLSMSPLSVIWSQTSGGPAPLAPEAWLSLIAWWGIAGLGWVATLVVLVRQVGNQG